VRLSGLIKHVAQTERQWMRFIVEGPSAMNWDGITQVPLLVPVDMIHLRHEPNR